MEVAAVHLRQSVLNAAARLTRWSKSENATAFLRDDLHGVS